MHNLINTDTHTLFWGASHKKGRSISVSILVFPYVCSFPIIHYKKVGIHVPKMSNIPTKATVSAPCPAPWASLTLPTSHVKICYAYKNNVVQVSKATTLFVKTHKIHAFVNCV